MDLEIWLEMWNGQRFSTLLMWIMTEKRPKMGRTGPTVIRIDFD